MGMINSVNYHIIIITLYAEIPIIQTCQVTWMVLVSLTVSGR